MPPALSMLVNIYQTIRIADTNDERPDHGLDSFFLSSTDLQCLAFVVHALPYPGDRPGLRMFLKRGLSHACEIRTMRLVSDPESANIDAEDNLSAMNPQLQSNETISALQELTLNDHARVYDLNDDHCRTWASAMNWNHLRKLDLDSGSPTHLLAALCGRVPQLKDLLFGFWPNQTNYPTSDWSCVNDTDVLIRFLNSIIGLECVLLRSWDDTNMCKIRPALLAKHGSTLRRLESDLGFRDAWDEAQFDDVYDKASGLESLKATMKMETLDGKGTVWPDGTQRVLTSFRSLRHLVLQINLACDSYQFVKIESGGVDGPDSALMKMKTAKSFVGKLWHDFGPHSAIEDVVVAFVTPNSCTRVCTFCARMKGQDEHGDKRLVVESAVSGPYRGYD